MDKLNNTKSNKINAVSKTENIMSDKDFNELTADNWWASLTDEEKEEEKKRCDKIQKHIDKLRSSFLEVFNKDFSDSGTNQVETFLKSCYKSDLIYLRSIFQFVWINKIDKFEHAAKELNQNE